MNWPLELLKLYEKHKEKAGTYTTVDNRKVPFLPLFHDTVNAVYEIVLTENGELSEIKDVPPDDAVTIVPVYVAFRTSDCCPNALCDNVKYIASTSKYHHAYMEKLKLWHDSDYSHPTVDAVYSYLSKETVEADLEYFESQKPKKRKNNNVNEKEKKLVKTGSFIRFTILYQSPEKKESHCWLDRTLHKQFISYHNSLDAKVGLDYLTGEITKLGNRFPRKLRPLPGGDQTTLISANNALVFTGLFQTKEEALSIGIENAYKVFNTLKWLLQTTGKLYGTMAVAVWNAGDYPIPEWDKDTYKLAYEAENTANEEILQFLRSDPQFAEKQILRMLDGYRQIMPLGTLMTLMALDSSSASAKGRCSIVNYINLDGKIFLDNIAKWHIQAGWRQTKWIPNNQTSKWKSITYIGVPGMQEIANLVYGREIEENGKVFIGFRSSDETNKNYFYKKTAEKLIPSIWQNNPLPYDMVKTIINKAMYPLAFKKAENWERVVRLACSFYKKHIYDKTGEVIKMALDTENKDRSYLFGRLLAVADYAEKITFKPEVEPKRITNSQRYMNRFVLKPAQTWSIIRLNLTPYLRKLAPEFRENVINSLFYEISAMMTEEQFQSEERLSPLFLLGYDCQMQSLKKLPKKSQIL